MNAHSVLWIYIVLLVAGGLVGFLKAKSRISLIMSVAFAAILALSQLAPLRAYPITDITLAFLLVFFGVRFAKGRKFMPAGLLTILTVVTLALRHLI